MREEELLRETAAALQKLAEDLDGTPVLDVFAVRVEHGELIARYKNEPDAGGYLVWGEGEWAWHDEAPPAPEVHTMARWWAACRRLAKKAGAALPASPTEEARAAFEKDVSAWWYVNRREAS